MLSLIRIARGVLVATLLGCSAPVSFAQGQTVALQLAVEQVQLWCFQDGFHGCQGEWLQIQPNRVQFSTDSCNTVFVLPAVIQQAAGPNVTPAIVVIDSNPPEVVAQAHRSGNVRVLTDICLIVLEAS
jgi:hypothetical protein